MVQKTLIVLQKTDHTSWITKYLFHIIPESNHQYITRAIDDVAKIIAEQTFLNILIFH